MKKILVCGAGGFIGTHLVRSLKAQGHYVIGADLKFPEFSITECDEFYQVDLRNQRSVTRLLRKDIDEIYQLAADMGGAGYIFIGDNDADIMHNSATINLNILHEMTFKKIPKIFYSSSACIYPERNQLNPDNPVLSESSAYPQTQTANMAGKNYSVSDCMPAMPEIMALMCVWPDYIMCLVRMVLT